MLTHAPPLTHNSPIKARLEQEVQVLRQHLEQSDFKMQNLTQEARHAMHQQKQGFERAAQQYEQQARDVTEVEVAQSKTRLKQRIGTEYQDSLREASHRLKQEANEVQNLNQTLQQTKQVADQAMQQ